MGGQRRSAAEVNFTRLARRMEEMVRDRAASGWRFGRYLQSLRTRLGDLKRLEGPLRPDEARIKYYEERLTMLQSVLDAEQRSASLQEKTDLLSSVPAPVAAAAAAAVSAANSNGSSGGGTEAQTGAALSSSGGGVDESIVRDVLFSKDVLALSKAHLETQARRELLSFSQSEHRSKSRQDAPVVAPAKPAAASAGAAADEERALQDSVTENMLSLARSLKQSARMSGTLSEPIWTKSVSYLSDVNYGRLKSESGRLDQQLARQCNWLLWFMVALVAVTFVGMVLFMRLFSKKIRPASSV
uniref:Vesicle transport protein USE1 n=1 Tax=Macrostomum lignano TaxID=282301 RepID=A0A1I8GL93_9PLAT